MLTPAPRPGDIREINGVPSLLIEKDDDCFLACPVKPLVDDEATTGMVVIVELSTKESEIPLLDKILLSWPLGGVGAALPELTTAIYPEHIGALLWRCYSKQLEKAAAAANAVFRDVPNGTFDISGPNSEEDLNLYRKMAAPSLAKMFALEADTEENGSPE